MTTALANRRGGRGMYRRQAGMQPRSESKRRKLPEYLEQPQIEAMMRAAPNPHAALVMLLQWRGGLRVSEALALDIEDLSLDGERPTLKVRAGKGGKQRIVPVHPELGAVLRNAVVYGRVRRGRLVEAHRATAWRWVQAAYEAATLLGAIPAGKSLGTHTLRHSCARHWLANGIGLNYVSRWLGHSSIQTTLIYLELLPDPSGSLARVP